MAVFVTGDTHGTLDLGKVIDYFRGKEDEYTKDDYLIICGDTGLCGSSSAIEREARSILRDIPVTTLFIDGNHENFEQLNSYAVDMWNGGKVHFLENDMIHLMRGQVYDIDGTSVFTFGGAYSTDKVYRTEGIDWFPEEIPSEEEYAEGLKNLSKHGNKVDFIITHTAPREVAAAIGFGEMSDDEIELRRYLQQIADSVDYKAWYFGHFHVDEEVEEVFRCLLDDVVRIV